jgi:hypothetical protein
MTIATEPLLLSSLPSETRVTATAVIASPAVAVANNNDHPRDGHNVNNHTRHVPLNAANVSAATTANVAVTTAAAVAADAAADNEDDDNNDVRIHLIEIQ